MSKPKYYHLTREPVPHYPLLEFPTPLRELFDEGDWPHSIDWLLPENVSNVPQQGVPHCRCPTEWLSHWYGMGTAEKEIAYMILRDILGYNPYQIWYHGWGLVHWWQTNAGDTDAQQARALNEMNYRLGYTRFFHVTIGPDWTGIPF